MTKNPDNELKNVLVQIKNDKYIILISAKLDGKPKHYFLCDNILRWNKKQITSCM